MNKAMNKAAGLLLALILLVCACTGSPTPPPATQAKTQPPATDTLPAKTVPPSPLPASPTPILPTDTAVPTVTPQPTATTGPLYGPGNMPANLNPLTGKEPASASLLERRPMLVKVELFPRGHRPVRGPSLADIVYDFYQNNGITRLSTLFYGQDAKMVNPIRSARLLDGLITTMYQAVFAFSGANKYTLNAFANSEMGNRTVVEKPRNCPPLCRYDPQGANTLYTDTAELSKFATAQNMGNTRQDLHGMSFDPLAPSEGQPGAQLVNRFSQSAYVRWDYDPASGRYLRFQDTQEARDAQAEKFAPFKDLLTKEQVAADNVVVLFVPHIFIAQNKKSEIVDIQLSGSGPAYAFRDGQAYEVRWNYTPGSGVLSLSLPGDKPYPFKPGTTWFEVMGQNSSSTKAGNGAWRFEMKFP